MSQPLIQVLQGTLRGLVCQTEKNVQYFAFKGIPYARPPVGKLRFAPPAAPEKWTGTRDATITPNIAPQYDKLSQKPVGDEDCLYLNVFTPRLPAPTPAPAAPAAPAGLPVMVFLHPGGFATGAGTSPMYGPDYLIERDVVLVSINYRLGVFGFLSLDRKEVPGNMGLKDQVAALRWVKANIERFGGDAGNVTVFGTSAGGASVELLLLSPRARGLFHRAVAQAGSALLPWARAKNLKQLAYRMTGDAPEKITNDMELYEYLMSRSMEELVEASVKLIEDIAPGGMYYAFVPIVEKPNGWEPFLDEPPIALLKSGEFTKVPYMAGFASREGLLMTVADPKSFDRVVKENNYIDFLPFNIEDSKKKEMDIRLKNLYSERNCDSKYNEPIDGAVDFFTDKDFLGGMYVSTKLMSKSNPSVYFYEFSYDGGKNYLKKKLNIKHPGATHVDEQGYLFRSDGFYTDVTDDDLITQERMVQMWTNFAKYGEPTPRLSPEVAVRWPPLAAGAGLRLRISRDLTLHGHDATARMRLFEELFDTDTYYD